MTDHAPHVVFICAAAVVVWAAMDLEHHQLTFGLGLIFMVGAMSRGIDQWMKQRGSEKKGGEGP